MIDLRYRKAHAQANCMCVTVCMWGILCLYMFLFNHTIIIILSGFTCRAWRCCRHRCSGELTGKLYMYKYRVQNVVHSA